MAPTIHCVRHAQGFHNLSIANHGMLDPMLTEKGLEQCLALRKEFPYHEKVGLVVSSPLKRTIQTAFYAFEDDLKRTNTSIITLGELQEISDMPCDTGSPKAEIEREFKGKIPVDLSLLDEKWHVKDGRFKPTFQRIDKRAADARRWLKDRPEDHIVVVTHGGFLHFFTQDWHGADKFLGTGWSNTEYRSYTFDADGGKDAPLTETEESRRMREGNENPLTGDERRNLKAMAIRTWQEQGLFHTVVDEDGEIEMVDETKVQS